VQILTKSEPSHYPELRSCGLIPCLHKRSSAFRSDSGPCALTGGPHSVLNIGLKPGERDFSILFTTDTYRSTWKALDNERLIGWLI